MQQDMFQTQEELAMQGVSSSIAYQILDFYDDIADPFPDTLRTSQVSSCFGGGGGSYDDDSFISPSAFSPQPSMDPSTFSVLLDSSQPPPDDDDIAAVISSYPPTSPFPVFSEQTDQWEKSAFAGAITDTYTDHSQNSAFQLLAAGPLLQPPSPLVYEEEWLPSAMSDPSSFMDAGVIRGGGGLYLGGGMMSLWEARQSLYQEGMNLDPEETGMAPMEMVAGGGGIGLCEQCYSSTDLQVLGHSHQHLVGGCGSTKPLVASVVSALDESSYKVGRLSVEERREKIHKYMKKKNERNFNKKIKYACRKTLADNRPRVRGRFVKNDEFGDAARPSSSTNHEYVYHEEVMVKDKDTFDPSDIIANISGVNSFQCNYTIGSWI